MTINLLFLTVTFTKRNYSMDDLKTEMAIKKISDRITDRKCSMYHVI
ncbi:YrzI family small protein [Bacillus salitolerans]|uniref:YrzI family small protein n=1 Tax=Bacillus salitolerans TaxID=1437434 RepID=A0ABW4LNV7_9BACI